MGRLPPAPFRTLLTRQVRRRRAGDRLGTGARARRAERADGGELAHVIGIAVPPDLAGLPGADGGGRRRGARDRLQCADRRRHLRARGTRARFERARRSLRWRRPRPRSRQRGSARRHTRLSRGGTGPSRRRGVPLYLRPWSSRRPAAIAYNRTLLATLAAADDSTRAGGASRRPGRSSSASRLVPPDIVGGGDALTQRALAGAGPSPSCPALSWCASRRAGLLCRRDARRIVRAAARAGPQSVSRSGCSADWRSRRWPPPVGFAVVGMAAFFTGVVRAPLTGIVLVSEMTGNVAHAAADAGRLLRGDVRADLAS